MENKATWTVVQDGTANCIIKTEVNGQIKIVPVAQDNSDYQEYLLQLDETETE